MDVQAVTAGNLNATRQSAPKGFAANHVVQTATAIAAALNANNSRNCYSFVFIVKSPIQQFQSASDSGFKNFIAGIPDVMSRIKWTEADKQTINQIVNAKIAQYGQGSFGQINQAELENFLVK